MQSRAAAAATAGARLTPCSCVTAEPLAERISVIWMTCAACRTLPQCTTGVYAVLQHACKGVRDADFLSWRTSALYKFRDRTAAWGYSRDHGEPGYAGGVCSRDIAIYGGALQGRVLTSVSGGQARRRTAQKKPLQATRVHFPGMSCKSKGTCHENMRRTALKVFWQ